MTKSPKHVAFCPHCGNTAPQRLALRHGFKITWYYSDGKPGDDDDEDGPSGESIVCICETCERVLVYDGVAESESGQWPSLSYPQSPRLHKAVPQRVRQVYEEALRIQHHAPNAFAVMVRRSLEEICDDRQVPSGTLVKRLKSLVDSGQLPPPLAEVTDVLRILGNAGAHASPTPVTAPQTWAMDGFFRVIVEYVYIAPHKLAEFRSKLNKARPATCAPAEVPSPPADET